MFNITIAQRVHHLRKMKGYTLEQLARLTAIEPSTLSRYESGDIRNPSVMVLQRICDAVGLTLADFFLGMESVDGEPEKYPEKLRRFDIADFTRRTGQLPPELRHMIFLYLEYLEYLSAKEADNT